MKFTMKFTLMHQILGDHHLKLQCEASFELIKDEAFVGHEVP